MTTSRTIAHRRPLARPLRRPLAPRRAGERGYVMALTALLLVPLMLITALAVDVGSWYSRGLALQRAADAGALAGVVYLPNGLDEATDVALEAIRKNGIDPAAANISVSVTRDAEYPKRLNVVLTDDRVPTFFGSLVRDSISMTRDATGEYILPVPLGSPNNFLGTRDLRLTSTPGPVTEIHEGVSANMYTQSTVNGQITDGEQFWLAVDSYCRGRMRGDLFVPFFDNDELLPGGDRWNSNGTTRNASTAVYKDCPTTAAGQQNSQFFSPGTPQRGMEMAVRVEDPVPAGPLHIEVYDAGFSRGRNNETSRFGCGVDVQNHNNVEGTGPSKQVLIDPPPESGSTTRTVSSPFDQNWTMRGCKPGLFAQAPLNQVDTTYTFYEVDPNLLDGVPNETVANTVSIPAAPRDANNGIRQSWSRLHTVPNPEVGEYRFTVSLDQNPGAYGVNGFAVRAYYGSGFTPCTTDVASTRPAYVEGVSCPQVYATEWLNIFLGGTIDPKPYLASIGPDYAGKTAQVTTFDPDFSAGHIGLLDPNGSPIRFDYRSDPAGSGDVGNRCGTSGTNVTRISINYTTPFDNCLITMSFEIPTDYEERFGEKTWWRIDYNSGGSARSADRSTWGVTILGDPVRLVIEQ